MTSSAELRRAFLDFFASRGHAERPSGPLVPANDPTLMFANAGMVQFKDLFTGKETREYKRATTSQKCIRISGKHNDLENVGVTARHHTFFEMLGNFSFGDYFKAEAIRFAWDFYMEVMKLDPERMVITVFGGEEGYGEEDREAAALWRDVTGFGEERIIRCAAKDNFWQMGDTGPCGPCAEIHYKLGEGAVDPRTFGEEPTPDGRGWFELWNLVFMQFDRQPDGTLVPLPAPSVDTGAGLERAAVVAQGVLSNYDTDLLKPLVTLASEISDKPYGGTIGDDDVSMRVIADHARTTAFLISEGIFPDRDGRPYVLRRVMRRAIRHGHRLGIHEPFLHHVALKVVDEMGEAYPQLVEQRALIEDITRQEEERFRRTLDRGLELLEKNERWQGEGDAKTLPGAVAFELYDTYGFPLDLQEVIGRERGFEVDQDGFGAAMEEARERSRGSKVGETAVAEVHHAVAERVGATEFTGYEAEEGKSEIVALLKDGVEVERLETGEEGEVVTKKSPFYGEKGGQLGDRGALRSGEARFVVSDTQIPAGDVHVHVGKLESGALAVGDAVELEVDHEARAATRRNHSATHLLHWALREVVGPTVAQKGSLVGPERLRFDYSGTRPLTQDELRRVEDLVNGAVLANTPVVTDVLPMDEAKARGAIGIFEEKYGEVVRVLRIGPSLELCGGTHAFRTGDIGLFTVLSEAGLAAGVRRIEATTGLRSLGRLRAQQDELLAIAGQVKARPAELLARVEKMVREEKSLRDEIKRLERAMMEGGGEDLSSQAREIDGVRVLGAKVGLGDAGALRDMADKLRDQLAPSVVLLGAEAKGKALLVCAVSKDATSRFKAGDVVREAAKLVGGGGGGRPDFAQAGGSDPSKLDEAVASVYGLTGAAG